MLLTDFQSFNDRYACCVHTKELPRASVAWGTPSAGWLKANVGAFIKEGKGRLGVVFRNDLGNVVLSCATPKKPLSSVLTAELQALWLASITPKDRDFLNLILCRRFLAVLVDGIKECMSVGGS